MLFFKKHKYVISLCCINKDENEYLEEWIKYHRKIGVDHFYIYDNGSKVPLKDTLSEQIKMKQATVIPYPGIGQQTGAYDHCLQHFGKKSKWIGFIDMDEFIVPKKPLGDLKTLLKDYERYGGLGINWQVFGSSGQLRKTTRPQIERFTLRSETHSEVNNHIKSIVQPEFTISVSVDCHHFVYKRNKFCVNENFLPITNAFSPCSTDKIQLNHYYCRSLEEYNEKIERGFADHVGVRDLSQFYSHDKGANDVMDTVALQILKR